MHVLYYRLSSESGVCSKKFEAQPKYDKLDVGLVWFGKTNTRNKCNELLFTVLDSKGSASKEAQNGSFPPQPQPQGLQPAYSAYCPVHYCAQ